jgi:hypothetical protein
LSIKLPQIDVTPNHTLKKKIGASFVPIGFLPRRCYNNPVSRKISFTNTVKINIKAALKLNLKSHLVSVKQALNASDTITKYDRSLPEIYSN